MTPSSSKRGTRRTASHTADAPTGSPRSQPLVATKFRPPSNHGSLIERPHLLERLRQTLSRKLALIHGPAGFGKTTLASQWYAQLKAEKRSIAWLSMDASDNDVNRFLSYLSEAIHRAEPEIGNGLLDVIESNPGSAADFVLDTLANDLSLFGNDFVLFLDDWHLIVESQVHDALHLMLSRCPPNLHLVVASRTRTGLALGRLRVGDELIEIDAAALRFDLEESRSYLVQARALELPAEDITALWRSTEGWAAALQLAGLSLRGNGSTDRERILQWTSGNANDIGEYLAENVLSNLPVGQLDFMLKTSILERMSGGLCAAVTGDPDSAERLDELERQELFLLPLDEERLWFRYHHLFAQYLQRRLKRQMPDRIRELHLKASAWLADHDYVSEAVEHALAAGETAVAVDLVESVARNLVENSFMSTLLSLVRKLPRTALFDRPELQMAIAWANCLTHRPQEAEEALWHVERVAADQPARRQRLLRDEALVVRACISVYADRLGGIEECARPCLDRADDFRPWVAGVAANVVAYQHIHQHRFASVPPLLHRAREYQDRAEGRFAAMYGRSFEGIAAYRSGDLANARQCFVEAMDIAARSAGKQSNAARLSSALLGQVLYESNHLDEAERLLRESRFLGFEGGVVDFYLATYLSLARLAMLRGDPQEALATLQEGEDTARALNLERLGVALACARVRIKLEQSDVRGAEQVLAAVDAHQQRPSAQPFVEGGEIHAHIEMARARLWCARGSAVRAVENLRHLAELAADAGWVRQELAVRVQLALALDTAGDPNAAEATLLDAIGDGLPRGLVRMFLDEGAALMNILERIRNKARRSVGDALDETRSSLAQQLMTIARHPRHGLPRYAASRNRVADLTHRETEVLQLLEQGLANKEIARKLEISVDTVKWFLKNVFTKLGVSTRTQAIAEARRLKIFDTAD